MKLHHLNCGTLRPLGGALLHGDARPWARSRLVTHVLLLELRDRLVLVDSGIGLRDVDGTRGTAHKRRLKMVIWAELAASEPAVVQLRQRGFDPRDVRDIVLTHLDFDHAGGLADFPDARVHVRRVELDAAMRRTTVKERFRYAPIDWAHEPRWQLYDDRGETWHGAPANHVLDGVWLVALPGHTRGHAGVAIETPGGWLFHVGDAVALTRELVGQRGRTFEQFQRHISSFDDRQRRITRDAIAELTARAKRVRVIASHDPDTFDALHVSAQGAAA